MIAKKICMILYLLISVDKLLTKIKINLQLKLLKPMQWIKYAESVMII